MGVCSLDVEDSGSRIMFISFITAARVINQEGAVYCSSYTGDCGSSETKTSTTAYSGAGVSAVRKGRGLQRFCVEFAHSPPTVRYMHVKIISDSKLIVGV